MTDVDEVLPTVSDEHGSHEEPKPTKPKGLAHYIGLALSFVLLMFIIFLGVILIVAPKIAGATPLTVLTSSMEPGLPPGTLVVVKPIKAEDVRVGDVITYQIRSGDPAVITHRVIAIDSDSTGDLSIITQGDNNDTEDDPVRPIQVQAKLWYAVPYLGWVNNWVNGANKSWIVPVVAGLLFAYAAYMIAGGIVSAARKGKRNSRRKAAGLPPLRKASDDSRTGTKSVGRS